MPLRVRLTLYYTLFFSLALLLLGMGLYVLMRQLLLRSVLSELRVGSALIQGAYQADPDLLQKPGALDLARLQDPAPHAAEMPNVFVQVVDPTGNPLARSPNLQGNSLPLSAANRDWALAGHDVALIERIGTTRVQSLIVPLQVGNRSVGVVQVAQSLRSVDHTLRVLVWALLGGGVVALLAAARGSMWLARAALRPIDQVSITADTILRAEDLHRRVPVAPTNDELGRLTGTINAMLARLDRVVTAQQQFTADVAHELRTPLTAMRGHVEILQRGAARDPALLQESLYDIESEVLRLTRMTNDLLVLAQADAGVPLRTSTVQLDELVADVYREARPLASGVTLRLDLDDIVAVQGDRDRLKQALLNLVANALHHTPAGGTVTLTMRCAGDEAHLVVSDTGAGIAPEQQATIFDRFVRGDRSRARGGAGLGLAIVKWVAEAHGGHVQVRSEIGHGSTFTIVLPQHGAIDHGEEVASVAAAHHAQRNVLEATPTTQVRR